MIKALSKKGARGEAVAPANWCRICVGKLAKNINHMCYESMGMSSMPLRRPHVAPNLGPRQLRAANE